MNKPIPRQRVWGLADRASILRLTLAGGCTWHADVCSSTLRLTRLLCGNGEWSLRLDTRSTGRSCVFGIRIQVPLTCYALEGWWWGSRAKAVFAVAADQPLKATGGQLPLRLCTEGSPEA